MLTERDLTKFATFFYVACSFHHIINVIILYCTYYPVKNIEFFLVIPLQIKFDKDVLHEKE